MAPPSPSSSLHADLERGDSQPPHRITAVSSLASRPRMLLLAALVLVALVNTAQLVGVQEYLQLSVTQDMPVSSDQPTEPMVLLQPASNNASNDNISNNDASNGSASEPVGLLQPVSKNVSNDHTSEPVVLRPESKNVSYDQTSEPVILRPVPKNVSNGNASEPVRTRLPGCKPPDKSHVDPNFFKRETCLTRNQTITIIKQLVFTAADAFDKHNVTHFLDSGTLLGAFRDQKVIPHDNDADVGIDAAGLDYLRHHAIAFPPEYFFTVWNSSLYPGSDRDDKLPARLIHRDTGLYLDVFAFLDWTDAKTGEPLVGPLPSWCFHNCASCPKVASGGKSLKIARDWIYPLVNCTFEGRSTMKCPHKTQQYLQYAYGNNYMTPAKHRRRLR